MFKKAVSDVLSFVIWHVMDVTDREASVTMLEVEAATVTYSEQLTVGLGI